MSTPAPRSAHRIRPPTPRTNWWRSPFVAALLVFGVALALRLLHILQIRHAPFFDLKLGDAAAYDAWARRIAGGDWLGQGIFYQAPLYPYVLGIAYRILGTSPLTVRIWQAVVSAASCALVADAGRQLFGRRAGILAGLMLACYAPAIFLDTLVQKSVLDLFFLSLTLWLVARLLSVPTGRGTWWLIGAALGCLSLTRENAGVLVVPLLLWLVAERKTSTRERLIRSVVLLAGLAAPLAPVAARNWIVGRELFVTTSQFGPNFYIGNSAHADGTYQPLRPFRETPAFEQEDATDLAEQALGRKLTPGEVSGYFTGRALAFIEGHPRAWLRLLARKFAFSWNAIEIPDTEDQYTSARWSWPVALGSVWHLGVLAPLAVVGLWITAAQWRRLWLLYLMLATYLASLELFYVFARYRFPVVPFLVLFAAAGLAGAARRFLKERRFGQLAGCAAVVLAVAVFSNWPMIAKSRLEAMTHYNVGVGLRRLGQLDAAAAELRAAIQMDPTLGVAHTELGAVLTAQGRLPDAISELERGIALAPDARAENNLGVLLAREGRGPDAIAALEAAIRLDPRYVEARRNLASLLAGGGRPGDAADVLEPATALAPDDAAVREQLARLYAGAGRLDAAADELRAAIRIASNRADLHNNLGIILARLGEFGPAATEFERALALDPDAPAIRRNLERIQARR